MFLFLAPETAGDGAADATAPAPEVEPNPLADGFSQFVNRASEGDLSVETWLLLWESVGKPVLIALVLIVLVFVIAAWVRRLVEAACRRAKTEETLSRFLARTARYAVLIIGGVLILGKLGVDTASLAALIAGAGFAIGMALSGMLGNVAAGIMLLFLRPFRAGDVVNAAGVLGKVYEVGLFTTMFDTFDNKRVFIPNRKIFDDNIETLTFHGTRRVDVPVGIAYSADVDKTREVLEGVVANVQGRIPEPAAQVFLQSFGDSSVNWVLRVWATKEDMWTLHENLIRDTKKALEGAGIGIPFPNREIQLPKSVNVRLERDAEAR